MLIACDIGGTNARFALLEKKKKAYEFTDVAVFKSASYNSFKAVLEEYLKKHPTIKFEAACFAVPGPVVDGVCKVTNLPWVVDAHEIKRAFSIPQVALINDLEAAGHALKVLPEGSIVPLSSHAEKKEGNRAIVSPGTGLGEAGLYWDGKEHHPFACEGGNADFAPITPLQLELSAYIMKQFHPSTERALSGPGLHNIFQFLVDVKKREAPASLKKEMEERDPSRVIVEKALQKASPLCEESLDLFVTILGQEASNLALKFMALGGVYLGGGIVPKILPKLKERAFLEAFLNKGRFAYLLEKVPVFALVNDFTALIGSFAYARESCY